jgi:cation diffusion facilitator family transporter
MKSDNSRALSVKHDHVFVNKEQYSSEIRTWLVMFLCFAATIVEIVCGTIFHSIALVADGIHMSTHCLAFFIAAFAYSYGRKNHNNPLFVFGTGKVIELASFTSAIILFGIALIICYEAIIRIINPESVSNDAFPVAFVGLGVNIASGFLLSCQCGKKEGDSQTFDHGHSHGHNSEHYEYEPEPNDEHDESFIIQV